MSESLRIYNVFQLIIAPQKLLRVQLSFIYVDEVAHSGNLYFLVSPCLLYTSTICM